MSESWANPHLLWLLPLALLPLLSRAAAIQVPSLPAARGSAGWLRLPALLYCFALALLVLALAGPQVDITPPLPRPRGHLMIILDVSASMGGRQGAVTRLEAATAGLQSVLDRLPPLRVGIVRAASEASLELPLIQDTDLVGAHLFDTRVEAGARGATALGEAIAVALRHLPDGGLPGAILLVSDGRNNYGKLDLPTAGAAAAAVRVPVFVIGVGTPAGAVPERETAPSDESAEADSLDVEGLTALSQQTGGDYAALQERDSLITPLTRRFNARAAPPGNAGISPVPPDTPRRQSRQPLFLAASGLLFCVSLGLGWGPLRVYP